MLQRTTAIKSAKYILITALIALVLLSGWFLFTAGRSDSDTSIENRRVDAVTPIKNQTESTTNTTNRQPQTCSVKDTISYLYYATPNEDNKRNNKFGIYIYAEVANYFELAQNLVNTNGGDWGYVLIPYNVKDRDDGKWNRVFEQLNNKHLIPIIQLHDVDLNKYKEQTTKAAAFLNSFIWPIKERYISVYNEPNDANFWYGNVDAAQYARILNHTVKSFKKESSDFFMLNGALNVSAATTKTSLDAFEFMRQMNEEVPGIFDKLDGWASHAYPQPNFSGSPYAQGRWSIRAYEAELQYLKRLGVTKDLPVFITETGWAHAEGVNYNSSYLPVKTIADYFKIAYQEVWLPDDRVQAVIPFTIRYGAPFDHFSWIGENKEPYEHYNVVAKMPKVVGNPAKLTNDFVEILVCLP